MFDCKCGTKFELTSQEVNTQKLVHGIRRYECKPCLATTLSHRRHQAHMAFQKKQSLFVKTVKKTASKVGWKGKKDGRTIPDHQQRGLASLSDLIHLQ